MITKKLIRCFEFENIYQFYDYVVESKVNGNNSQCKDLVKQMNKYQFIEFMDYLAQEDTSNKSNRELISFVKMRLS